MYSLSKYYKLPKLILHSVKFNISLIADDLVLELISFEDADIEFSLVNVYCNKANIYDVNFKNNADLFKLFGPIKYFAKPKVRGNNKWNLIGQENKILEVDKLPDMLECSINSHVHPKFRNWYLVPNAGLSLKEKSDIDWRQWQKYEQNEMYINHNVIFRSVVELLKLEFSKNHKRLEFEDWCQLLKEIFKQINAEKFEEDVLNNLFEYYLRDFASLW